MRALKTSSVQLHSTYLILKGINDSTLNQVLVVLGRYQTGILTDARLMNNFSQVFRDIEKLYQIAEQEICENSRSGDKPSTNYTTQNNGIKITNEGPGYQYETTGLLGCAVSAWAGKTEASWENDYASAKGTLYGGKSEAYAGLDGGVMQYTYGVNEDGTVNTQERILQYIALRAGTGASITMLSGDLSGKIGNDKMNIEGKVKGEIGKAEAGADAEFSVGEKGVNVNLGGRAMVSAATGEASSTINLNGLAIKGIVKGHAGAAGVEGKVGIKDNKYVTEVGAAVLFGATVEIEVGLNDQGIEYLKNNTRL